MHRWKRTGKEKSPRSRRGGLKGGASSLIPQSNPSDTSGPSVSSLVKKYKSGNNPWMGNCVHVKGKPREAAGGSPQPQTPAGQNQTDQDQGAPALPIDITSCQWLSYKAYIGNETRSMEFKQGGGSYMQMIFSKDVEKYGCAFLNSEGGSLLVGVSDDGVVHGVCFFHKKEDEARQLVDWVVRQFLPPLLPHNYSLRFLPVIKPGEERHPLKVLCLTFTKPLASTEPTLYRTKKEEVYIRRDASVQGPLSISDITELSRQIWARRMQQLEQSESELKFDKCFLAGQVYGLHQLLEPLERLIALHLPQSRSASFRQRRRNARLKQKLSLKQNSGASISLPSAGTPDSSPTHNTGALDSAQESTPAGHSRSLWM